MSSSDKVQMEILRGLYRAQLEIEKAYNKCEDESLKAIYDSLNETVYNLENKLELFEEN